MKPGLVAFVLFALTPCSLLAAKAKDETIWLYGPQTCGEYMEKRQADNNSYSGVSANTYTFWFHGLASGYNAFETSPSSKKIEGQIQRATVIAYFDKYCRDHPMASFFNAGICLIREYGGGAGSKESCN
jgi:hypothetical protein